MWAVLLVIFGRWLEVLLARPHISRLIPDYESLLVDPVAYLDRCPGTRIPPYRARLVTLVVGLMLPLVVGANLLIDRNENPNGPGLNKKDRASALIAAGVGLVVAPVLIDRSMKGGEIRLGRDGVTFRYRGKQVVCSWSVFRAVPGTPSQVGDRIDLLVYPCGTETVVSTDHGRARYWQDLREAPIGFGVVPVTGQMVNGHLTAVTAVAVSIYDLYACPLSEVVTTLLAVAAAMPADGPTR